MSDNSNSISTFTLQLLELEQRFESYCSLYEEEMKDIRTTLNKLRESLLVLVQRLEVEEHNHSISPIENPTGEEFDENESFLAL